MEKLYWPLVINKTMIDYLLKFSSKRTAYSFALTHGFAIREQYTDKIIVLSNGTDYSLYEIGSHMIIDELTTESISDGKYWIALRLNRENGLPDSSTKYIVWSSLQGLPRPKNNPDIPNISWA